MSIEFNLDNFDADVAKKLSIEKNDEIEETLKSIYDIAISDKFNNRTLFIYSPLKQSTLDILKIKGFVIEKSPNIQKDELHYKITW